MGHAEKELQKRLQNEWKQVQEAKTQAEVQQARARALRTYRTLKLQIEMSK